MAVRIRIWCSRIWARSVDTQEIYGRVEIESQEIGVSDVIEELATAVASRTSYSGVAWYTNTAVLQAINTTSSATLALLNDTPTAINNIETSTLYRLEIEGEFAFVHLDDSLPNLRFALSLSYLTAIRRRTCFSIIWLVRYKHALTRRETCKIWSRRSQTRLTHSS